MARGASVRAAAVSHVFTAAEWRRMGELSIFAPDDRLELFAGVVLDMPPIGPPHAMAVTRLQRALSLAIADAAVLRVQCPVHLDEQSEPVPDLALGRLPLDAYEHRHPGPHDLLLLVEVAETTLAFDLGEKADAYARAGVPETWVVDLPGRRVAVLTDPGPDGYRSRCIAGEDGVLTSVSLPEVHVAVRDFMPRREPER